MAQSTLFRSEVMSLIQLYIPSEVAQHCVSELGELGKVQFRDVSELFILSPVTCVYASLIAHCIA